MTQIHEPDYWDNYYSTSDLPDAPSDFARFVSAQYPLYDVVLELGAGNGRDVALWSAESRSVIAVDRSSTAIDRCRGVISDGCEAIFVVGDLESQPTWDDVESALGSLEPANLIIFARFLMHALPEHTEDEVLTRLHAISERYNGVTCFEFRTTEDSSGHRVTEDHYRRYIQSSDFVLKLKRLGFAIDYLVEGVGYARYKDDDAYVARILASPGHSSARV